MYSAKIIGLNPKKFKNLFYLSLPLLLTMSLGMEGCKAKAKDDKTSAASKATPPPVLTVSTFKPEIKTVTQTLSVTGALAPWDLMSVQASANGLKVLSIYTDSGQTVSSGQVLVRLDDSMLKAQLASANASLSNSLAQLSKAKSPNRDQDVLRQQASLAQAKANLDNASENAKRYETLYSQGAISKLDLDTRRTTFETAEALYKQEQQRLSLINAGSRSEDIRIAQSSVDSVKAQIQQINVQLSQTVVKAPDSGLVLERLVHLGDVSSSASRMFTIIRNNRFELQAKVPEADLRFINTGDTVQISSDANPNLKTSGKVRQIGPGVDQASRQATVKIDVAYIPGMQTGQFVKGIVGIGTSKRLMIPTKSIINTDGTSQVFLVENAVAKSKSIEVGVTQGNLVEVKSGLKVSDEIIHEGAGFIRDGDRVKIVYDEKNRRLP